MQKLTFAALFLALVTFSVSQFLSPTGRVVAQVPPTDPTIFEYCERNELTVVFVWKAAQNWDAAWVDLSLADNGFQTGTFLNRQSGPGVSAAELQFETTGYFGKLEWSGIKQGTLHYWRVNLRYGDRWSPSAPQTFVSRDCETTARTVGDIRRDLENFRRSLERLDERATPEGRLDAIEQCLGMELPYSCPYWTEARRLTDIEDRLSNLEQFLGLEDEDCGKIIC